VRAHPQIEAKSAGLVRFRDDSVRPGAKLGAATFVYVLDPGDLVARFVLPERWRGLVRTWSSDDPAEGRAEITVGGLGGERIGGRVTALAAAETGDRGAGARGFTCTVRLERPDPALRAGMRVACALALPLGQALAVLPTWCLDDLRHPRVELADGHAQDLEGYVAGDRFVVVAGLAPGARLRLPAAAPAAATVRLTGVVEARESVPVRLSSGGWELLEAVPDGTLVHRGDVIAKLSKSGDWRDLEGFRFADSYGAAQANADFAIARLNAERDRAQALLTWQEAAADAAKARIDAQALRARDDSAAVADARAADLKAGVEAAAARRAADALADPGAALGASRNEICSAAVAATAAALAAERAHLAAVGAERGVDLLALADADAAWRDAEDGASASRAAYTTACSAADAALERARLAWRDAIDRHRRDRESAADAVVLAPRDGRVYQRLEDGGQPLTVGEAVETAEPFTMPVGPGRMFTVEVPARFYGRFAPGQQVSCVVPALGHALVKGEVLRVAAWFHAPAAASAVAGAAGAALGTDKVFGLTIALDLDAAQADRVPPGATASIDL
jgi:multidrug efflux pump subunit AcrA (membrane-fusion protein)